MRALLDANVYISFLLTRNAASPLWIAVDPALGGAYDLLISDGVIDEVRRKTTSKPYLARRISQLEVERLIRGLRILAESIPDLDMPYPEIGRDRKDDYLFAHALIGQADYLVSGDTGVRGIDRIGDVRIVTPAEFVAILQSEDQQ
jgi:putative PIN family toxin of toxin-antitoxin system